MHILQLRPTPARLQKWNEGAGEPNLTHRTRGWTAFLQELAPLDILKDIQPTSSQLVNRRQELLTQMYEVAEKEEDFLNDRGGKSSLSYSLIVFPLAHCSRWR